MRNIIFEAVLAVSAIGFICAVMLAVVSKLMHVPVDERISTIREALPGANCGACGFAGCDGYAQALVNDGAVTNLCMPGGDSTSRAISGILGVAFADVVEKVAVCHCSGIDAVTVKKMEYEGVRTCTAAKMNYSGEGACPFGCMGYGDCVKVCPSGAIRIENAIAFVNAGKCIGCGLCTRTCPNSLLKMHDDIIKVVISCSSHERGAAVRKCCTVGCIGCQRCAKECPEGAITMDNNLAVINDEKCTGCGRCVEVCPAKTIRSVNLSGALK